jgi:hypothetical protein
VRKQLHIYAGVFFGLLGILQTLGTILGWGGSRAPDIVYGDEMNFPEGIILLLVSIELFRHNARIKVFAVLLAILNEIAGVIGVITLARPVAFSWVGIWLSVFAVAYWSSMKVQSSTPKEAVKLA